MGAVGLPLLLAGASTGARVMSDIASAGTESAALKMQATQESIAATQRMGARVDQMNQVLGAQEASAAARGLSLASTTLKAANKSSFDKFLADKNAEAMNQQFRDANLQIQLAAVRNREFGDIFSAVTQTGMAMYNTSRTDSDTPQSDTKDLPD